MPLNELKCKNAKPSDKIQKLSDEKGMYLQVNPSGGKTWQLKYRFEGKEKKLAIGSYPETSLKEARDKRDDARKQLQNGIDPSAAKKQAKIKRQLDNQNSFEAVAKEWHEQRKHMWTERHAAKILKLLNDKMFPALGNTPIDKITPPELLAVLRKIEAKGHLHTAHRMQQTASQIFRYAVASGKTERDVAVDLRGALTPSKKTNYASLSETDLPEFLAMLEQYDGEQQTQTAMKLLIHTFVRTGELRGAKWEEINFDKAEWRIPAERMKMREQHIVPLTPQVIALFRLQQQISCNREFVFPNRNKPQSFMSENTILYAIYRMGYHSRTTAHGFRATASTILNEKGFNKDHIERQLAHGERSQSRKSYNHAQYLAERRKMMQWWSNFIDGVRK